MMIFKYLQDWNEVGRWNQRKALQNRMHTSQDAADFPVACSWAASSCQISWLQRMSRLQQQKPMDQKVHPRTRREEPTKYIQKATGKQRPIKFVGLPASKSFFWKKSTQSGISAAMPASAASSSFLAVQQCRRNLGTLPHDSNLHHPTEP